MTKLIGGYTWDDIQRMQQKTYQPKILGTIPRVQVPDDDVQTYEEFMSKTKRKTPMPKELRVKKVYNGCPNLTKNDIFKHVVKGTIKIDFKSPFIKYDCGKVICTPQFFNRSFEMKKKIFDAWYKFYKKRHKLEPNVFHPEEPTRKIAFPEDEPVLLSIKRRRYDFKALSQMDNWDKSKLLEELSISPDVSPKNRKIYEARYGFYYRKIWEARSEFHFHSWTGFCAYVKDL